VSAPVVKLRSLDTLWFQVGGTLCNLTCTHCLVSASPTNHTHEAMTLAEIRPYLDEAQRLGVKEYYFTGGEPFLNPEMESILEAVLPLGPATVLTNGLRFDSARCERLATLGRHAEHSLDLRVSLDGYDAPTNDPIRGVGTFDRVLRGLGRLARVGLDPVVTVTEACPGAATAEGRERLIALLRDAGLPRPRLKILPLFRIGAEAERGGGYAACQRVREGDAPDGWDHLQCSSCRMVTDLGVWVCPILVNEPRGRMGARLADTLEGYPLDHAACWTCHAQGATCRT